MNPRPSNRFFRGRAAQRGSVFIIVMLIAFGLISIALYFANSMTMELRASANRSSGVAADQAIEGAARYVAYILSTYATNGVMPTTNEYQAAAVPVGDSQNPDANAHFWIIGRDPSGTPSSEPYFSLIDEASKLNLNFADSNTLSYLPNMTVDFADAIVDWRSTNGSSSLTYSQLGYEPKQAPFETVDELRLVYGATEDLLVGDDVNQNGVLDANETDVTGNGQVESGLFEYTTVYSREPNFHSNGTMLTNVNSASQQDLTSLLQNDGVNNASSLATQIHNSISPAGRGAPANPCAGVLDFAVRCRNAGMSSADFARIYNDVAITNALFTRGRVNINTASAAVLTALFEGIGVDQSTAVSTAQQLVTYRQQNPYNLTSVAWILDALGANNSVVTALRRGDYITTRSFQFTADIAALGPYGRGYRRVKFIFDISTGKPVVIYRQDLTRLGWALGRQVREIWVTKTAP